ncbi:flagellar motor protein MotB [Reinekea sp. G2M2-21]|uniref:flagellar motor protein MotB n=1 Tax=Reinekea sp. G2M2-21 TaxID=2788942 RepID=UPI0018A98AAD
MNQLRRQKYAGNADREHRWIISYADFLTLLFAFFAFLFSISSLQTEKFQQVSETLLQLFDVQPSSVEPIELLTTPQGPDVFNPLFQPEPLPGTNIDIADSERYSLESTLLDIQKQLSEAYQQLIENQLFSVSGDESWIEIQIADSVTFLPGSADITNDAEAIFYEVGKLLSSMSLPVSVEGYSLASEQTETVDGWDLTSQRATNVLRYLQRAGIGGQRLSAVAFSHYQPSFSDTEMLNSGRIAIVVAGFERQPQSR